jgi:nicotinate-nucleotide adenylyltransferase
VARSGRSAAPRSGGNNYFDERQVVFFRPAWYRPAYRRVEDTDQIYFWAYDSLMQLSTPSDNSLGALPVRIGVFGGTFDPPHIGHLVTAINVRFELKLDRVLMVVANEPWQKVGSRRLSSAADRFAMVQAAVVAEEGIEASDVELQRGGPSYTVDTLATLRAKEPNSELFLILGGDAAAGLESWERPEELARQCQIIVVDRPGVVSNVPSSFTVERVSVPRLEVSSTDLRERAATNAPLQHLIPEPVISLISKLGLYGDAQ